MVDGVEGRTMTTSSWLSKYMSLKTRNKAVLMLWFTRYADRVAVCIHTHFFWANLSKRGKVQWGQLCVKHQPAKEGHTTAPGTPCPTLYDKYVSSLTSPTHHMKMQETGPTIYHPYPRRLEHLTICRCHSKGSMFSSVILRPWVLVRSEARTRHFPHGSPALYNWANRSVCKALMPRWRLN